MSVNAKHEADALSRKCTFTNTSNEQYANQEVVQLLQRIKDSSGTVILATNFKSDIDETFSWGGVCRLFSEVRK